MSEWRVAKSLLHLRDQVNAKYPTRLKGNDGTIGDEAHAARASDHNPDDQGVVRAMDITHDPAHGFNSYTFADLLKASADKRIKYLISNYRICTPSISPEWRPYHGVDPHHHHVHISVVSNNALADSTADWVNPMLGDVIVPKPAPTVETVSHLHEQIVATVFDSVESGQRGAYGKFLAPTDMFIALPYTFTGERPQVRVYGPKGMAVATVEDIGPWNINDPYWLKIGGRPQAESGYDLGQTHWGVRKTNKAGIDLSPALGKKIGVDGKGIVKWEFVDKKFEPAFPASPAVKDAVVTPVSAVFRPHELPVLPGANFIADLLRAGMAAIFGRKT